MSQCKKGPTNQLFFLSWFFFCHKIWQFILLISLQHPPSSLSMQSLRTISVKTVSFCRTLPSTLQVSAVMLCPLRSSLQLPVAALVSCSWASTDSWVSTPPSLHSLRYDLLKSSMTVCSAVTSHWPVEETKHTTDKGDSMVGIASVIKTERMSGITICTENSLWLILCLHANHYNILIAWFR